MKEVFEVAVLGVLAHEGGYVDDPNDSGGATNFGISQRQFPDIEIASITVEQAKAYFRRDYWDRYRIGFLPGVSVPAKILDTAVLAGPATAIMLLQRTLNALGGHVAVDGIIGPQTVEGCRSAAPDALLVQFRALLLDHLEQIALDHPQDKRFLKGWRARALA